MGAQVALWRVACKFHTGRANGLTSQAGQRMCWALGVLGVRLVLGKGQVLDLIRAHACGVRLCIVCAHACTHGAC